MYAECVLNSYVCACVSEMLRVGYISLYMFCKLFQYQAIKTQLYNKDTQHRNKRMYAYMCVNEMSDDGFIVLQLELNNTVKT